MNKWEIYKEIYGEDLVTFIAIVAMMLLAFFIYKIFSSDPE